MSTRRIKRITTGGASLPNVNSPIIANHCHASHKTASTGNTRIETQLAAGTSATSTKRCRSCPLRGVAVVVVVTRSFFLAGECCSTAANSDTTIVHTATSACQSHAVRSMLISKSTIKRRRESVVW